MSALAARAGSGFTYLRELTPFFPVEDGHRLLVLSALPLQDLIERPGVELVKAPRKPGAQQERLFDLPASPGGDHAEGLTVLPGAKGTPDRLLVVYERVSRARKRGASGVIGDVFVLPR